MDAWEFYKDDSGNWRWRHISRLHDAGQSVTGFLSRNDCIADAMRHGYLSDRPVRAIEREMAE